MKQTIAALLLVAAAAPFAHSQDFATAREFFATVAERYSAINDYVAEIEITTEEETLAGTLYYRRPNDVRIDFTEPEDQVLVSDGEELQVYVPEYDVVLQQSLAGAGAEGVTALASTDGLRLMQEQFSVAYLDSPDPVPLDEPEDEDDAEELDEDEQEMVTKLRLTWRSSSEGFRQLTLSIDEERLIRRIEGVTVNYDEIELDFLDVQLDQSIPDSRFDYEAPASANLFTNFLFEQDD